MALLTVALAAHMWKDAKINTLLRIFSRFSAEFSRIVPLQVSGNDGSGVAGSVPITHTKSPVWIKADMKERFKNPGNLRS